MRNLYKIYYMMAGAGIMFVLACQQNAEEQEAARRGRLSSMAHFADAQEMLDAGNYSFAAAKLNKAIVAYRKETGMYYGERARKANHAIDELILLRKMLRNGNAVDQDELTFAIQQALAVEGLTYPYPREQQPTQSIGVPVGGH